MEFKTCEEYVLAELERVSDIKDGYLSAINSLVKERDELREEKERLEVQCERMARRLNELNAGEGFEPVEVTDGDQ